MSFEPSAEMKAAYTTIRAKGTQLGLRLADLAQHATAAALKAEHQMICLKNGHTECKTYHKSDDDWLKLADERLREVAERALSVDREWLGKLVRLAWVKWAREQPDAKPSWLVPWEELGERDREVDRRIGEFIQHELMK